MNKNKKVKLQISNQGNMETAKKSNRIEGRNRHITVYSSFSEEKLGIEQSRCAEVIVWVTRPFSLPSGPQIAYNYLNPFIPERKHLDPPSLLKQSQTLPL